MFITDRYIYIYHIWSNLKSLDTAIYNLAERTALIPTARAAIASRLSLPVRALRHRRHRKRKYYSGRQS